MANFWYLLLEMIAVGAREQVFRPIGRPELFYTVAALEEEGRNRSAVAVVIAKIPL